MGRESRRNHSTEKAADHRWVHPLREWRTRAQRHDTKLQQIPLGKLVRLFLVDRSMVFKRKRPGKFTGLRRLP
jgi:hypothetical protein